MVTCASNVNVTWVAPRDRMSRAIGLPHTLAGVDANSGSSIAFAVRPTVEITPSEPVRRLGTGWQWWFSESVHVPIGQKIEFRFQGPAHLLVLYIDGLRRSGETSIDGLQPSRLRSFVHKLTFVPGKKGRIDRLRIEMEHGVDELTFARDEGSKFEPQPRDK